MEEVGGKDSELLMAEWVDVDIEVALDSGCCDHVMDTEQCAPGYEVHESEGSRRGAAFLVGNGERIPNEGEVHLNLVATATNGSGTLVQSVFQVAEVNRPLMSVSKVCDNGFACIFTKDGAYVLEGDRLGQLEGLESASKFERHNGLYTAKMKLKPPEPFRRQAQ